MNNRFIVYNASAGSGKTFQIATHYLNKLMQAQEPAYIYRLLGITFTNKAAAEMKERVLQNLINASKGKITDVMKKVADESKEIIKAQTGITNDDDYKAEIVKRSQLRLSEILHHYDDFQLTTIDKMMYKIIRTFARDMNLPVDVEVVLDHKEVIVNLIDKLIAKAVRGEELTKFFINLSISKTDEDKSWKIQQDLLNINNIIFDANYFSEIKSLENKTFADFKKLKTQLIKERKKIVEEFSAYGKRGLKLFEPYEAYVNGSVKTLCKRMQNPKEYNKIEVNSTIRKLLSKTDAKYYVDKRTKELNKTNPELARFIKGDYNKQLEAFVVEIVAYLEANLDKLLDKYRLYSGLLKEINALSIQKALLDEIEAYKDETHSIFINDFNKLILEQILQHLESDTPYIYMRLGEKYSHYFVDEFQDTSELQWHNLIPLIHEALSKEFSNEKLGDVMLVGDAKQSIYRFRGGKPEQFMALSDENAKTYQANPFAALLDKKVEALEFNWRSEHQVITFNNHFFQTFPDYLTNNSYRKVYENVAQKTPEYKNKDAGFVQIEFVEKQEKQEAAEDKNFALGVLKAIKQAEENGFLRDEICVLVDKHAIGVEIAETLIRHQVDIISSESLVVRNAAKVQFLLSWIKFLEKGASEDFYPAIHYLQETHQFNADELYLAVLKTDRYQTVSKQKRIEALQKFGFEIHYEKMIQMNLYDLVVYLIQQFKLNETQNEQAYLQAFVEEIHQYYSKKQGGIRSFLLHWQNIEEKFSIKVNKRSNAVNIMTVHKSKGLEFPVLIYYTKGELLSKKDKENRVWMPINPDEFAGFEQLPVEMKVLEKLHDDTYQYLYEKASEERIFDNLNRLYVALTRASEQLFVVLEPLAKKPDKQYNAIFERFIVSKTLPMQTNDEQVYQYGNPKRQKTIEKEVDSDFGLDKLYFRNWQTDGSNQSLLKINTKGFDRWREDKKNAILHGMLIHDILSKIDTYEQWKIFQNKYVSSVKSEERNAIIAQIEKVLLHPNLSTFFTDAYQILNERDILIPQQKGGFTLRRPDRMVINDNAVTIIDYKTGAYNKHHEKQLNIYADLLSEMNYKIAGKYLVYIKNDIEVVEVAG
jgi:ATP-dependent exoDNAse (exonuclease V) beta subunit